MGLISYKQDISGEIYQIEPTDSGLHYFESAADEKAKTSKVFRHEWRIAVFSALAGALLSRPLWSLIEWIVSLF